MLALYYVEARPDAKRTAGMIDQFVRLAMAEGDMNRLIHYRADVDGIVTIVAEACDSVTIARLQNVLTNRFLLDSNERRQDQAGSLLAGDKEGAFNARSGAGPTAAV